MQDEDLRDLGQQRRRQQECGNAHHTGKTGQRPAAAVGEGGHHD
jgi:hypothetical protein